MSDRTIDVGEARVEFSDEFGACMRKSKPVLYEEKIPRKEVGRRDGIRF